MSGTVYKVNEEGVAALQALSQKLPECAEAIKSAAEAMRSAFDDNRQGLGPHDTSIENILEEIKEANDAAADPVEELSEKIGDVAEGYQDIIDNDRYGGSGK